MRIRTKIGVIAVAVVGVAGLALGTGTLAPVLASGNTNINQTMWNVGANPGPTGANATTDGSYACPQDPTGTYQGQDTLTNNPTYDAAMSNPSAKGGQAVVHVKKDGSVIVDISVSGGAPNIVNQVDLRCKFTLGGLATDAYGDGSAEFTLTSAEVAYIDSNTFAFDVAPPNCAGPTGPECGYGGYGDTFISSEFSALGS